MHNGLSIYQAKYCKTTFLASPCLCYILFNRPVVGKQHYYARSCNKPTVTTELQPNLQKHITICCCSFNKVLMKKKKLCRKKILTFFDVITWDSLMV